MTRDGFAAKQAT